MLLRTTREKPSARGQARRIDRIAGAGNRARAERERVGLVGGRSEPRVIAAKRGGVRQEVVRDEHRLGAAQVRVGRHQRRSGVFRLVGACGDQRRDRRLAATGMRRRRYNRRSSDTCSLRERPVCSRRPASPIRSTSLRSTKL